MSKNPTKAQSDFCDEMVQLGCIITGGPAEIHHIVGRTCKHNKVPIGHWLILAINDGPHRNDPINLTTNQTKFCDAYRKDNPDMSNLEVQKCLFWDQLMKYEEHYNKLPPIPVEAYEAIMDYGGKGGRIFQNGESYVRTR